ncbi:MAG: PAS domain S-box protein [Minisyncoccales bacterium]
MIKKKVNLSKIKELWKKGKPIESFYRGINEAAGIFEIIYDKDGRAINYKVLDVNKAFTKINKVSQEKAIGSLITKIYSVAEAPYLDVYAKVVATGKSKEFEAYFPPTNKYFYIYAVPLSKNTFSMIALDVSKYKDLENMCSVSEVRYRRLFETAKEGIILVNFKTGLILDVNQYLIDLFGFPKQTILGKHLWEANFLKGFVSKSKFSIVREKEYVYFKDLSLKKKSGEDIIIEFVANAYRVNGEKVIQCNIRDVTERKEAEEELRKSQKEMADIINFLPDATLVINKEGRVIVWNRAIEKMTGIPAQKIIGKGNYAYAVPFYGKRRPQLADLVFKKDKEIEKLYPRIHREGESIIAEVFAKNLYNKKGAWVYAKASLLRDQSGNIMGAIESVRDITDRKEAEKELKDSEEKFSKVFQTSPYASVLTRKKDGKIVNVNDMFLLLTGYSRKEALNKTSIAMNLWVDLKDRNSVMGDLSAGRLVKNREYLFRIKKGDILTGLYSAQLVKINSEDYLLSSIADITERKKSEQQTYNIKMRDEAILASIGDAVLACDTNGKVLLFNKIAEDVTGFSVKEVMGKHYNQVIKLITEKDETASNDFIDEAIKKDKRTEMANHVLLIRKDGSKVPVADSAAPIKSSEGKIIGCVVVFRDVTKDRQLDQAKSDFLSLSSHQLRTPLSATKWVLESILDDNNLDPKQKEKLNGLHTSNERLIHLVNDLLNVNRVETNKLTVSKQYVDLRGLVDNLVEILKPLTNKKNKVIKINAPAEIKNVYCDPILTTEAIENILTNAIYYSPENSQDIDMAISEREDDYLISIHNSGVMSSETISKIKNFERFVRGEEASKKQPSGSGLGLYITKKVVEASGGTLWFESNTKIGTIFYITITKK